MPSSETPYGNLIRRLSIAVISAIMLSGFLPLPIRHQIAYLPQNFLFDRRIPMTVAELVGLGWDQLGIQVPWANHRKRQYAVREALARVEADHLAIIY